MEEGQVFARVVAHRVRTVAQAVGLQVRGHELVHRAAVPAFVQRGPLVRDVVDALAAVVRVEVERQQMAAVGFAGGTGERLVEDRFSASVGERQGFAITEAANAAVGAEVAVERAVLVDEDHDMLDVGERPHAAGAASTCSSTFAGAASDSKVASAPAAAPARSRSRRVNPDEATPASADPLRAPRSDPCICARSYPFAPVGKRHVFKPPSRGQFHLRSVPRAQSKVGSRARHENPRPDDRDRARQAFVPVPQLRRTAPAGSVPAGPLVGPAADPLLGDRARRAPDARRHRRDGDGAQHPVRPLRSRPRARAAGGDRGGGPVARRRRGGRAHPPPRRPRRRARPRARAGADQRRRAAVRPTGLPAGDASRPAPAAAARVRAAAARARRRAVRRVPAQPCAQRRRAHRRGRHARAHSRPHLGDLRRRRRPPRDAGRRRHRHARAAARAARRRGRARPQGARRDAGDDPRPLRAAPRPSTCPRTTPSPRRGWPARSRSSETPGR